MVTCRKKTFILGKLKDYIDKDTVLIASVDFSHYLTGKEAEANDKISLNIIEDYNYEDLFSRRFKV